MSTPRIRRDTAELIGLALVLAAFGLVIFLSWWVRQ